MRRTEDPGWPQWPLWRAARRQGKVIGALMLREVHTRYGRENLGFLWFTAEPLLFCLLVIGLWVGLHGRFDHGVPIVEFVMTGYLPLTLWSHVTSRAINCLRANAALLYHRQVKMVDLFLARILLEVYGSMIAYLVAAFVFWSAGLYELPRNWSLFYLAWFYFILLAAGLGLVVGSLSEMSEWVEKFIGPVMFCLLPVSGAFFMADWLPDNLRAIALWIPTVSAYELLRAGQFGKGIHVHYDLAYLSFVCGVLVAAGLALSRRVHRYLVLA